MANVYSLTAEGIHNAEIALERAARKIASAREPGTSPFSQPDTVEISSAGRSAASPATDVPVDYAAEIIAVKEAETALKANIKACAVQRDLEHEAINLYA